MSKLVILSGVPGSGKSYFSKSLKKLKSSHVYVVSSDELRREITGIQSNLSEDELMWKLFYSLAKTFSLDKDGVVILDATHVTTELRVSKNKQLKKLFDLVYLVVWDINHELVEDQNQQRDFPIPEEALKMFFNIFEMPSEKDYQFFDKVFIIKDHDITPAIKEIIGENG